MSIENVISNHHLGQLFKGWPPRDVRSHDQQQIITTGRLIAYTANAAGIMLTQPQIGRYAVEVVDSGAKTDIEIITAFDQIMRKERPNPIQLPYNIDVEGAHVTQKINKLLCANKLYRMPFQIDAYVSEILKDRVVYGGIGEESIFRALHAILGREETERRGVFVVGQKPLTGDEASTAIFVRQHLAKQGESWSLKDIDVFAVEIVREAKEAGVKLSDEMIIDAVTNRRAVVEKPIHVIGEAEITVKSAVKIAAEEMLSICQAVNVDNTAHQEPVRAYSTGTYYGFYRNDVLHVIAREYGVSPVGNPLLGSWVLRKFFTGEYIDHDHNRNDLAERHAIKLES